MTRDETINVIHKTIYQFFDGGDGEPMSDKDELLLAVNKAICNNIKALEQEPSGDAISRQAVLKLFATHDGKYLFEAIRDLPSVTPTVTEFADKCRECGKQRTGHWIRVTNSVGHFLTWKCYKCGLQHRFATNFCPDCGAKMESEEQA